MLSRCAEGEKSLSKFHFPILRHAFFSHTQPCELMYVLDAAYIALRVVILPRFVLFLLPPQPPSTAEPPRTIPLAQLSQQTEDLPPSLGRWLQQPRAFKKRRTSCVLCSSPAFPRLAPHPSQSLFFLLLFVPLLFSNEICCNTARG